MRSDDIASNLWRFVKRWSGFDFPHTFEEISPDLIMLSWEHRLRIRFIKKILTMIRLEKYLGHDLFFLGEQKLG